MDTIADIVAFIFIVLFVVFFISLIVLFDKRNLEERRERVLGFLVEGEIDRLTYQNLSLVPLEVSIEYYYTKEEITPELLEYIENNFMRVMSEKLEGIEESKRPRFRTPYRDSVMTLEEIEQIVTHHLNTIKDKFYQKAK